MSLGILCSGQGMQSPAMLDVLVDNSEAARVLDRAASHLGIHPRELVACDTRGLFVNRNAQPLVCAAGLAAWAGLRGRVPPPAAFAGYSVGELTAHACAGSLETESLLALARRRAELMDAADDHPAAMVAVRGLATDEVERLAAGHRIHVAIVNGADRVVVAGLAKNMAKFSSAAEAQGASLTPLSVGVASHTPLMAGARAAFADCLRIARWGQHTAPVLAGIDGSAVRSREAAIDTLATQLDHPVRWDLCLAALIERGCTVLLELGPGNALARMAAELCPEIETRAVADFKTLDGVAAWVGEREQ